MTALGFPLWLGGLLKEVGGASAQQSLILKTGLADQAGVKGGDFIVKINGQVGLVLCTTLN